VYPLGCFTKPVDRELVDIHQALVPGKSMEMRMFTMSISQQIKKGNPRAWTILLGPMHVLKSKEDP